MCGSDSTPKGVLFVWVIVWRACTLPFSVVCGALFIVTLFGAEGQVVQICGSHVLLNHSDLLFAVAGGTAVPGSSRGLSRRKLLAGFGGL